MVTEDVNGESAAGNILHLRFGKGGLMFRYLN
jgi:hypothetical protein